MNKVKKILFVCRDKALSDIIYFCLEGWGYEVEVLVSESINLSSIKRRSPDLVIIDFPALYKETISLCKGLKDDFITKSIPVIVLIDKRQLRKHLLTLEHGIDDYLFKPPDPLDLRIRVEMALRRTQYSFYTNALTNLPGGRIIEDLLKDRFRKKEDFFFAHVDIDNFKAFNDKYGYIKGDKVITQTAYILYQAVKSIGKSKGDFIGHIGGDDFVFLTASDKGKDIGFEFIYQFDRLARLHYPFKDREKGYIEIKDRDGQIKKMQIMSVTVAAVNNRSGSFDNVVRINETLAGLKSYLKKIPGSKLMIERRKSNLGMDMRKGERMFIRPYETIGRKKDIIPLGQMLIKKGIISGEELDAFLDVHWRKGLPLGEILKDKGVLKEEELEFLLAEQKKV